MKRPLDQEALPPELRAELLRSRQAGHEYDALGKLPQLRAALNEAAASGRDPLAELESSTLPSRFNPALLNIPPLAWKLALIAAIGSAVFIAWPRPQQDTPARAPVVQRAQPAPKPQPATEAPAPRAEVVANQDAAIPQPPAIRSSRREIAQLVRIRALLERDPIAAYRLAQRSESEFPQGLLSEERQALQVLALAKSGSRDAAERKARAFFERYPQSPMRERIEGELRR